MELEQILPKYAKMLDIYNGWNYIPNIVICLNIWTIGAHQK